MEAARLAEKYISNKPLSKPDMENPMLTPEQLGEAMARSLLWL